MIGRAESDGCVNVSAIRIEFDDGRVHKLEGEEADRWLTAASNLSVENGYPLRTNWTKTSTNQSRVAAWVRNVFTEKEATDVPERSLRMVEEAIELTQACGVDAGTLHRLVDYVFSRPTGTAAQEIAGCLVTVYAAASALGVDADAEFEIELARIQQPEIVERCRRRQHEKRAALAPPAELHVQPAYSSRTKLAHGAVIEAAMGSDREVFVLALRQLATMVHCDIAGELREPHTLVPDEPTLSPSDPWRDALPRCHWGTSCGKIGTKWIARQALYCDDHGAIYLPDAPWAALARQEGV